MRIARRALLLALLVPTALVPTAAIAADEEYDSAEWTALPDDDARAAVEKLHDAAKDNDIQALLSLTAKSGVRWMGARLTRKALGKRLGDQGVPAFLGLPINRTWRFDYTADRPDEIVIGERGGGPWIVRLEPALVVHKELGSGGMTYVMVMGLDGTLRPL
jgi:hypothetical protein